MRLGHLIHLHIFDEAQNFQNLNYVDAVAGGVVAVAGGGVVVADVGIVVGIAVGCVVGIAVVVDIVADDEGYYYIGDLAVFDLVVFVDDL